MVPLALPTVATLTPDHYDIHIYDEDIEPLPLSSHPDIVGITTLAATITRAYELADHYRSKGVKVVLGGSYASFMTEEALKHADTVVVGEAEGSWEACLKDFEKGSMKPFYKTDDYAPYKTQKPPRWDLINTRRSSRLPSRPQGDAHLTAIFVLFQSCSDVKCGTGRLRMWWRRLKLLHQIISFLWMTI